MFSSSIDYKKYCVPYTGIISPMKRSYAELGLGLENSRQRPAHPGHQPLEGVRNVLKLKVKKLKPDKFFMGKPSQNYGVPPKYGAHNFTCSPT